MLLKILQNSLGNTCARVSFLRKLQDASNFINKQTSSHHFLWSLRNLYGQLFCRTSANGHLLNFLFLMISQKRKYYKSNNNCESKGNTCTSLNWSFIWKVTPVYFFKTILKEVSLTFAFTISLAAHIKNRFCFSLLHIS